ncbi:DUF1365 domain-containing protein [Ideonella livida]|uniref:DUF1365 domain-containing protein n=1 Tax=Ideonella livida TaxID=2707176 RepID=A0A7C9TLD8_9BURK|nr:DUF1365 domain-containing protein [Ideonella livida]NDY91965.1 DUF1365 domain-containing protein [Ideonella livida]
MRPASAPSSALSAPTPLLGLGEVRHTRLRPVRNAFAYPTFFLLLPLRRLRAQPWPALARNRWAPIAFHDADHGDGGPDALAWMEALLAREGVHDADGEIWLHCYPRVLGHTFKPVSFWYCHRADGSLAAVVAEVNNTFGERHCYLLTGTPQAPLTWGRELVAQKVFHVSPFCRVAGGYRFRFLRTDLHADAAPRTVVRIEHDDEQGPLLLTSVSGRLQPLSAAAQREVWRRMPLMTLGVVARIHWQALRLWCSRVPFFRKPAPPPQALTPGRPASP